MTEFERVARELDAGNKRLDEISVARRAVGGETLSLVGRIDWLYNEYLSAGGSDGGVTAEINDSLIVDNREIASWWLRRWSDDEQHEMVLKADAGAAVENVMLAAVQEVDGWTMDTPASYAQRTRVEQMEYQIWVLVKKHVEAALAAPDPLGEATRQQTEAWDPVAGRDPIRRSVELNGPAGGARKDAVEKSDQSTGTPAPAGPSRLRTLLEWMRARAKRYRETFTLEDDKWYWSGLADGCDECAVKLEALVGPAPVCEPQRQEEEKRDDLSRLPGQS